MMVKRRNDMCDPIQIDRQTLDLTVRAEKKSYATIVLVDISLIVDTLGIDLLGIQRLICEKNLPTHGSPVVVSIVYHGRRIMDITQEAYEKARKLRLSQNNDYENAQHNLINLWDLIMEYLNTAKNTYEFVLWEGY